MTSNPPTPNILPGYLPHLLTLVKNSQMNFPYHTESVLQHVAHFKTHKKWKKMSQKLIIFHVHKLHQNDYFLNLLSFESV